MTTIRRYSQLVQLDTFEDRFRYLALRSSVGQSTFGFERYLNQKFYTSREWRQIRDLVITRDNGCDLGVDGYEIHSRLLIHHMNPMTSRDIVHRNQMNLDPDHLITTTHRTHNAIHYGDERQLLRPLVARSAGDTKLW